MTRVCHISTVHDPLDVRVFYKECSSLAEHFETYLVIGVVKERTERGVHLVPVKKFKNKFLRVVIAPILAFIRAKKTRSKLYHLHDPELLVLAPLFRLFGHIVIFDKHENIAGQILSKKWLGPKPFRKIASLLYNIAEKIFIGFCNKIVVVIPEMQKELGIKRTVLVRNFPSVKAFGNSPLKKIQNLKFIYAGGLTPIRGIKETISAFELSGINAELLLVGKWSSEDFRKECMDISRSGRIKYMGFLPMDKVYDLYESCQVGLCLLHPTDNYKQSLPVKVFEYYFAGMKVLMSNIEYWKKEFGTNAMYADPFSQEDLTNAFKKIELEFIEKGEFLDNSNWAKGNYSWESEFDKLLKTYKELL